MNWPVPSSGRILLIFLLSVNLFSVNAQVIKNVGGGLTIGNGISPAGNLGFFGNIGIFPNTMIKGGVSVIPGKLFIGIAHQLRLSDKFWIEPGIFYHRVGAYSVVFDEDTEDERFYSYSAADFFSPALSFKWKFNDTVTEGKKRLLNSCGYVFTELGYSHRFSDYTIQANYITTEFYQRDRERIYHRNYNSNFFWNIGVQLYVIRRKK